MSQATVVRARQKAYTDWREMANDVINEFGFLVLGSPRPRRIGEIILNCRSWKSIGGEIVQPLRIYAEATEQDYDRQSAFVGRDYGPASHGYFYKVITD